mmetsp:Transcript_34769/g.66777  ORF Transcript_34769/g.66777 Transcript_34769/m.66777 type:complete len:496 (-) Transcript_34769:332-1819(-)
MADERLLDEPDNSAMLLPPMGRAWAQRWFVYLAFFFPALAGFLFGYDIGAASGAVNSVNELVGLSSIMKSLLTSSSLIGATVGSIAVFWLGEPLGRRREILTGATLYVLGSALSAISPNGIILYSALVGRAIYGLGIAFSMHAAPVYISEMSPSDIRGQLVSAKEGFIVFGIMAGFSVSAACQAVMSKDAAFRGIWAVPLLIGTGIFVGMFSMPPSPRWLLLQASRQLASANKYRDQAVKALQRFRRGASDAQIEAEVAEIEQSLGTDFETSWKDLLDARRALVAGLGLISLQQLTGQPSVLYYQQQIFEAAGFGSFSKYATVIIGAAKLIATLFAVRYVDNFGRRPLLFVGTTMMLVSLVVLGTGFFFSTREGDSVTLPPGWPPVIVVTLVAYVCGYQVGFGPIAWLIISEVFPLKTRTRALSAAVTVNFGFNLLMTFTLQLLQDAFDSISPGKGQSYLFYLYGVLCVLSLVFVWAFVPETKGKSLEEIQQMLK